LPDAVTGSDAKTDADGDQVIVLPERPAADGDSGEGAPGIVLAFARTQGREGEPPPRKDGGTPPRLVV
jgi:hypothetical protein